MLRVSKLIQAPHVERELLLIKACILGSEAREEVKRTCDIYRGQIVEPNEIIEVVRSGICSIARGDKALRA